MCNYGALKGMPIVKLEAERSRRIHEPFPDGESYLEVVERVRDFLSDVSREWDGKRILVVGHAATRWALQHLLFDGEIKQSRPTVGLTVYIVTPGANAGIARHNRPSLQAEEFDQPGQMTDFPRLSSA